MSFYNERLALKNLTGIRDFVLTDVNWMLTSVGDYVYHTSSEIYSFLNNRGKIAAQIKTFIPFIYERTQYFNELVPQFYLQFNDVVNSKIDSSNDLGTAQLNAINRIGNFKMHSKRNVFLLADGFNQESLSNMLYKLDENGDVAVANNFPTFVPFFPPDELVSAFVRTTGNAWEYMTSRIQLTASDSGYKHYIKSNHPDLPAKTATERWAFETRESSGYKNVVISPYLDNGTSINPEFILGAVQDSKDMSTATGSTAWSPLGGGSPATVEDAHKNIAVPDIEAVLDRVYSEIGDAMGTFLPDPDSHTWINQKGQVKMKLFHLGVSHPTDSLSYLLRTYEPTMTEATLLSSMEVNRDTGSFLWRNNDDTMQIEIDLTTDSELILIKAGDSTITVNKDGDIDIVAATGVVNYTMETFTITGDLHVTGKSDLDGNVTSAAEVAGDTVKATTHVQTPVVKS